MKWPEYPNCHSTAVQRSTTWRKEGSVRSCSYCGSIHPEDLLTAISEGTELGGADWKYGYPHKFYLEGASFSQPCTFYTAHLEDSGYDDEAIILLLKVLSENSGIKWVRKEDKAIYYRAPYFGYQHWTNRSLASLKRDEEILKARKDAGF